MDLLFLWGPVVKTTLSAIALGAILSATSASASGLEEPVVVTPEVVRADASMTAGQADALVATVSLMLMLTTVAGKF